MPIGGSSPNKTFTREVNVYTGSDAWQQLDAAGRAILSVDTDDESNDQADALNAMLMKDGGNFSADLPTNGFKFTGVGNASARTHFAAAGQVQDGSLISAGTSAGTNTITASLSPAITAYVANMVVVFRAGGTNTGAATLNLNSVGAADLKKGPAGTIALEAGDITTGGVYIVSYNGTTGDFELVNPGLARNISAAAATILDDASTSAIRTTLGVGTGDTPTLTGLVLSGNRSLQLNGQSGGQGGGLQIQHPASGTSLAGTHSVLDSSGNFIRIFENGGTSRGAFIDLTACGASVATALFHAGNAATQPEQEAASSLENSVTPGRQHFHPSAAKMWAFASVSGGVPTLEDDYNVTSITDAGTGLLTVTIATDFSSANWSCLATMQSQSTGEAYASLQSKAAGEVQINSTSDAGAASDSVQGYNVVGFGDFA